MSMPQQCVIRGAPKGGGGLVLCDMCKNHLLAMCYVKPLEGPH